MDKRKNGSRGNKWKPRLDDKTPTQVPQLPDLASQTEQVEERRVSVKDVEIRGQLRLVAAVIVLFQLDEPLKHNLQCRAANELN